MPVHDNVILDLLPLVRGGHASSESQQLVEEHLRAHPELARMVAGIPSMTPELELRALQRTRKVLRHSTWEKAAAMFFTVLPMTFVFEDRHVRFLFADYPGLIVGMAVTATVFWFRAYWSKRCNEALGR